MNDLPQLPDFLTLWTNDATLSGTTYTWNIPDSYYSNDRVSTCYVSLVSLVGNFAGLAGADTAYACILKDGAANYSSTKNNGIVLGFVEQQSVADFIYHPAGSVLQPMIKSNPQTLSIVFTDLAGTDMAVAGADNFVLSLRFDYINPISQAAGMEGTLQPNLLK